MTDILLPERVPGDTVDVRRLSISEEHDARAETLGDLVSISNRLTRVAAHATGNAESPAVWRTLSVLRDRGALRIGELAVESRVSQPTTTKLVRALAEREWVRRVADVDDARAWQVRISSKGLAALDGWRRQLATALLPLFDGLSDEDRMTLTRATGIIEQRIARADGGGAASAVSAPEPPSASERGTR